MEGGSEGRKKKVWAQMAVKGARGEERTHQARSIWLILEGHDELGQNSDRRMRWRHRAVPARRVDLEADGNAACELGEHERIIEPKRWSSSGVASHYGGLLSDLPFSAIPGVAKTVPNCST